MKGSRVTEVGKGARGIVTGFSDELLAQRMLALGVLPGALLEVVQVAPFRGGFYLKIDGRNVVVRHSEAEHIHFEWQN